MNATIKIENNFILVSFKNKPDVNIRHQLKERKYTWDTDKYVWKKQYSKEEENTIRELLEDQEQNSNVVVNNQRQVTQAAYSSKLNLSSASSLLKIFKEKDIVPLPVSATVYEKTLTNTVKKFQHTLKDSIHARTHTELLADTFMGDLAKNTLIDYLRNNCNQSVNIVDYDEIRIDNFENPDEFDFYINNKSFIAEVKSSTPPVKKDQSLESPNELIYNRDIKIIAKKNKGQKEISPVEMDSYIYPQIYFFTRVQKGRNLSDNEIIELKKDPHFLESISEINIKSFMQPMFYGWSAKPDIIFFSERLCKPQWEFGNAVYWSCPLRFSRTMKELIDFANQIR